MQALEIIPTGDGSSTLRNPALNETYHSVNGAMTESLHVFIHNGLQLHRSEKNIIHILEVGMGTGLNALLSMEHIPAGKTIYYTALEPYPIGTETVMAYFNTFEKQPKAITFLHHLHDEQQGFREIIPGFVFRKTTATLQKLTIEDLKTSYHSTGETFNGFDIVYYDAFGPQKQPDMWTWECISKAAGYLNENGLLVSYCAQGQFKRHLKALNLRVTSPAGPPGKRQMTVAFR